MIRAATFSANGLFRYKLLRFWGEGGPTNTNTLGVIMLNPSTADANRDDNTIRKLIAIANHNGFRGLHVVNLYAKVATDPKEVHRIHQSAPEVGLHSKREQIVGISNDFHIQSMCQECLSVVAAWGCHPWSRARANEVCASVHAMDRDLCAFRVSRDGSPWHPLYLPTNTNFEMYRQRPTAPTKENANVVRENPAE